MDVEILQVAAPQPHSGSGHNVAQAQWIDAEPHGGVAVGGDDVMRGNHIIDLLYVRQIATCNSSCFFSWIAAQTSLALNSAITSAFIGSPL